VVKLPKARRDVRDPGSDVLYVDGQRDNVEKLCTCVHIHSIYIYIFIYNICMELYGYINNVISIETI
jgi:hypothetical protein